MSNFNSSEIINNYLNKLGKEDLEEIVNFSSQKFYGDDVRLTQKFEKSFELDRWLRSAETRNEWYSMVDSVTRKASSKLESLKQLSKK